MLRSCAVGKQRHASTCGGEHLRSIRTAARHDSLLCRNKCRAPDGNRECPTCGASATPFGSTILRRPKDGRIRSLHGKVAFVHIANHGHLGLREKNSSQPAFEHAAIVTIRSTPSVALPACRLVVHGPLRTGSFKSNDSLSSPLGEAESGKGDNVGGQRNDSAMLAHARCA